MFKMEITIDKAKIIEDGMYSPAEIMAQIDQLYQRLQIDKQAEGVYVGGDFAKHGAATMYLKNQPWFMPYVDKWLWYNSKGSDRPEDFVIEDVAAHYALKLKASS